MTFGMNIPPPRGTPVSLLLLLGGVLLLAAPAPGQQAAPAPQTLSELMEKLAAHKSGTVGFKEVKHLADLTEPLVLEGTLHYNAPKDLRKDVHSPRQESYRISGDVLTLVRAGEEPQELMLSDFPQLRAFIESFRATLAGDEAGLKRHYRVDLRGSLAHWMMRLSPADDSLAEYISRIEIRGSQGEVKQFAIFEADGDSSLIEIIKKQ